MLARLSTPLWVGLFLLVGSLVLPTPVRAGPPAPVTDTVTQPDGSRFEARAWGDERSNGMETVEGYTILLDPGSRFWVYAVRAAGGDLVPASGPGGLLVAGRNSPAALPQHIRPEARPPQPVAPGRTPAGYIHPNLGQHPLLVLLVQFNNRAPVGTTADYWSNLFFGTSGKTAHNYYAEVSYGQFNMTPAAETSGTANDGVVGWLSLNQAHPNPASGTYDDTYVYNALVAADPYVNYAAFDTNGNGSISYDELYIVVIAAGYENSYGGANACSPRVWAHQSDFSTGPTLDGKQVAQWNANGGYATMGEWHCKADDNPGHAGTLGQFMHELGHEMGLPDLYDTVGSDTAGIGVWGIMGSGSWNSDPGGYSGTSPAHPEAWSKWYEGWLTPSQIVGTAIGRSIPQAETNASALLLLDNPGAVDWSFMAHSGSGEYFLVENRQKTAFDQGLPGCGLLIWHIDESVISDNTANANQNHRLVDLQQADGLNSLDTGTTRGDAGDPYPGSSNNLAFNAASNPNSNLYSGAASGVSVTDVSPCASSMTANVSTPGGPAPAIFRLFLPLLQQSTTPAPGGIRGQVTVGGIATAGVSLSLYFYNGSSWSSTMTTTTDGSGNYLFTNVPSLGAGQKYYVRYDNNVDTSRLSLWKTRELTSYTTGSNVSIGDFDLANIGLVSPPSASSMPLPVTFQWNLRTATPTDSYAWILFDPADNNPYWNTPALGYTNSYTLTSLPAGFVAGTQYGWGVSVSSPDGGYGESYFYRRITFITGPTGIRGRVTMNGAAASGVSLLLRFWNGSAWSTASTTATDGTGNYLFTGVPSLTAGQEYYVRYNNPGDPARIGAWWTRSLTSYTTGSDVTIGNFDLANISLASPSPGAVLPMPVTFEWNRRPATPTDSYEFDLFDPADSDPYFYTALLGYAYSYTLNSLPSGFAVYTPYGWDVYAYSPDGGYGVSYYYRQIGFLTAGGPETGKPGTESEQPNSERPRPERPRPEQPISEQPASEQPMSELPGRGLPRR